MIINLTDIDFNLKKQKVVKVDKEDLVLLREALADISKSDVAVYIISNYDAETVLVDVSPEYLELLQDELEDYEVILGDEYECA